MAKLTYLGSKSACAIALACTISLTVADTAIAQIAQPNATADDESSLELDSVFVTARRTEERLVDVPLAITALDGDLLRKRELRDFKDFAAQVPGFSLQTTNNGLTRLILRGQNSGGTGSTVGTVIDEVPLTFSSGTVTSSILTAAFSTFDLERVEVLRGPQGTLYGASAQGGLIKYVTKAPALSSFNTGFEAGYETVDGGQAAGLARGFVNLPLINEVAALRVSGFYEGVPGYVDNELAGREDSNDGNKSGIRASLLVSPTSNFTARLTGTYQELDYNDNVQVNVVGAALNGAVTPSNAFDPIDGFSFDARQPSTTDTSTGSYNLNLEWDAGPIVLSSITSFSTFENSYLNDLSSAQLFPGLPNGFAFGPAFGQTEITVRQRQNEKLEKTTQEFRIASSSDSTFNGLPMPWQVGVFHTNENVEFDQFFDALSVTDQSVFPAPPLGGAALPSEFEELAFFGNVTLPLTEKLDIEFGARWAENEQSFQQSTFCCVVFGPLDTTTPPQTSKEDVTTYSIAPRFKFGPDTVLYGRIATGYRPGGPNFFVPGAPAGVVPPTFTADKTTNYEIGYRTRLFEDQLGVELTAFYIDWTDIQIISRVLVNGVAIGFNSNAGEARSKGVEGSLAWTPKTIPGLNIGLIGAYVDAELASDAAGIGALDGDQLSYAPEWSGTVNADYRFDISENVDGFVGGSLEYVGDRYGAFTVNPILTNHPELPSFEQVHLQGGVDFDEYRLELFIRNLTNTRGLLDYRNEGGLNATGLASFTRPRTVGVKLSANF